MQDIFKWADEGLDDLMKQDILAPILLDLAMYENDDLVQDSLQLLNKIFSSELHLFQRAIQAQLLTAEESEKLYRCIENRLHLLRQYLNPKRHLHSQSASQQPSEESPLKELIGKCWIEGEAIGFEPHQQNQKIIYNFGEFSGMHACDCVTVCEKYRIKENAFTLINLC